MKAGLVKRARIVLLAADGMSNQEIATRVGASRTTVDRGTQAKHRHQEFLAFLRQIERTYRNTVDKQGEPVELHLVMDNYTAHKHAKVKQGWPTTPGSRSTSPRPTPRG